MCRVSIAALPLVPVIASWGGLVRARAEPNPPRWPSSVKVFSPADDPLQIQDVVNAAFASNGGHVPVDHGQFSTARFAFLFLPGTYRVDVPVGYYTQVLGLGASPGDVVFEAAKGVYSEEGDQNNLGGALSTFWRSAENFRNRAPLLWAVSQAAPLRRIITDGDLNLAQYIPAVGMGYSSGGFVGNVQVGGALMTGSQQQFCTRNSQIAKGMRGGVWNMVFVGTVGAPPNHCGLGEGHAGTVTVGTTPVIAEKPFIRVDGGGRYYLQIPPVQHERAGVDFTLGETVDFQEVYVALPEDGAAVINERLAEGLHVVLAPGIYNLGSPLEVRKHNQVLLGLGLATLVATSGTAAIRVGNVGGVRIAGVLLQAGEGETQALLEWGEAVSPGDPRNPGFLHDVFARVGGPNDQAQTEVRAEVMIQINSGHVVGDNLWLWRADHGVGGLVRSSMNPCRTGLVVRGNDVTMYSLAAEHTLGDLVQWSGERGRTYFYQSELPYDVSQGYGDAGYVGYRVNGTVRQHEAWGVGVYHYFRDFAVTVPRGIAVPPWLVNRFEFPLGVYLSGKGKMLKVINDMGGVTEEGSQTQWVCVKGPDIPYSGPVAPMPAAPLSAVPASRLGFVSFDDASYTLDRAAAVTAEAVAGSEPSATSSTISGWAYLLGFQGLALVLFSVYQSHHRRQASAQPLTTPVASPTQSQSAWPSQLGAQMRLRNLASLTRTSLGAPSPAGHSDVARSVVASPAESAFGARSPHWSPEEL